MHVALDVAPTAPENVRAGHAMQAPDPAPALYVPAGQGVQDTPAPVNPATHSHVLLPGAACVRFGHPLQLCAPGPANVFAGHSAHAVDPFTPTKLPESHELHASALVVFLYLPTAHAPHGPFSGPVYPRLHKQRLSPLGINCIVLCSGQHTWFSILLSEHTEQLAFATSFL